MKLHSAEFEKTLTRAWHAELLESPAALKAYRWESRQMRVVWVVVSFVVAGLLYFLGKGLVDAHVRLDLSATEVLFRCGSYVGTILGSLAVYSCVFGEVHLGYLRCPLNRDSLRRLGFGRLRICWFVLSLGAIAAFIYCGTGLGKWGWESLTCVVPGLWFSTCLLMPSVVTLSLTGRFQRAEVPRQMLQNRVGRGAVISVSIWHVAVCLMGVLLVFGPLFALGLNDTSPIQTALLSSLRYFPSDWVVVSFFDSLRSGQFGFASERPWFLFAVLLVPVWLKLLSKRYRYDDLLRSRGKVKAADTSSHDVATLADEFGAEMAEVDRWRRGRASRFLFAGRSDEEMRYFDASVRMKKGWGIRQSVFAIALWCSVTITLASIDNAWAFMLVIFTMIGLTVAPCLYAARFTLLTQHVRRGLLPGGRCVLIRATNCVGCRFAVLLLPLMLGCGCGVWSLLSFGYLFGMPLKPVVLGFVVFAVSIAVVPSFSSLSLLCSSGQLNLHSWKGWGLNIAWVVSLIACPVLARWSSDLHELLPVLVFLFAVGVVSRAWCSVGSWLLRTA